MFSTFFEKNATSDCNHGLTSFLTIAMKKNNVPVVSYAIIQCHKILAVDHISIDSRIKVKPDSIFQACSLSKTLTAYAILTLVSEGKLDLDSSINGQLHSWKIPKHEHADEVTVRQCLNMTSGLCYGELNASFSGYLQNDTIPTLNEILCGSNSAHNLPIKLCYRPGSHYHYSGAGYMVLQQLIEDTTNLPFSRYMKEEIFLPLQMMHSTFECPLPVDIKVNAISGFNTNGQMIADGWENIVTTASGGLWSTPSDLANFALAYSCIFRKDNTIIPPAIANKMLKHENNLSFKLGHVIDGEGQNLNFRKNGHNTGYHNELLMFPHTGQGIVVMTNSANSITIIKELIVLVAHKYKWPLYSSNFDELTIASNTDRKNYELSS